MPSDAYNLINSRTGLRLAQFLSRIVPQKIGHRAAYLIADMMSSQKDWDIVKATRCNQWVVGDKELTPEELDRAVHATFRNTAQSIFDLHHYMSDFKALDRVIEYNPLIQSIIKQSQSNEAGVVVVSLHLGNFDLALQALTLRGLRGMVFSLPPQEGGYQVQYKIREKSGVALVPLDRNALRQAITRLRSGGTVITMLDFPTPDSKYAPTFFGQPSAAPVHYVYIALKAEVPVLIAVMLRQSNGRYAFLVSDPIHMQTMPDRHDEMIYNSEAVLRVAECYIRIDPHQWAMPRPLWPELIGQVPK